MELHPRRWQLAAIRMRCELCGADRKLLRLEVADDGDESLFCCLEHPLSAAVTHPLTPEMYEQIVNGGRRRVA